MKHVIETSFSAFPFGLFFSLKTGNPSPMNMAKGSINISEWKRGTLENGVKTRWLTTAGVLKGRHRLATTRSKRRRSECLMNFLMSGYCI
jgi:hypothetical protein